jgi:hypothetical protein
VGAHFESCVWEGNTAGCANGIGAAHIAHGNGTGWGGGLQLAAAKASMSMLRNCTWVRNRAGATGGGARAQDTAASFDNCTWISNMAGTVGGGLDLNRQGVAPAVLTGCRFEHNTAGTFGGGAGVQDTSARFVQVGFANNSAGTCGGGLFLNRPVLRGTRGERAGPGRASRAAAAVPPLPPPDLLQCDFAGNTAGVHGGGVYTAAAVGLQFEACAFRANAALRGSGGGARIFAAARASAELVRFEQCRFEGNKAAGPGGTAGGLSLQIDQDEEMQQGKSNAPRPDTAGPGGFMGDSSETAYCSLLGTVFVGNQCGARGGAMDAMFPADVPANLRFTDGCTGYVCQNPTDITLNNEPTVFAENTARLWRRSVVLSLTDGCHFSGNQAAVGGALAMHNGAADAANVSFHDNGANLYGGAVYLDGTAALNATDTAWVRNRLFNAVGGNDLGTTIADGSHLYAVTGAGEWRFAGLTEFDMADTKAAGLAAAQTDGAHGLSPSSISMTCPPGAAEYEGTFWQGNFTAVTTDWVLGAGLITTNHTNSELVPGNPITWRQLPSNITTRGKTGCEEKYFGAYCACHFHFHQLSPTFTNLTAACSSQLHVRQSTASAAANAVFGGVYRLPAVRPLRCGAACGAPADPQCEHRQIRHGNLHGMPHRVARGWFCSM